MIPWKTVFVFHFPSFSTGFTDASIYFLSFSYISLSITIIVHFLRYLHVSSWIKHSHFVFPLTAPPIDLDYISNSNSTGVIFTSASRCSTYPPSPLGLRPELPSLSLVSLTSPPVHLHLSFSLRYCRCSVPMNMHLI